MKQRQLHTIQQEVCNLAQRQEGSHVPFDSTYTCRGQAVQIFTKEMIMFGSFKSLKWQCKYLPVFYTNFVSISQCSRLHSVERTSSYNHNHAKCNLFSGHYPHISQISLVIFFSYAVHKQTLRQTNKRRSKYYPRQRMAEVTIIFWDEKNENGSN